MLYRLRIPLAESGVFVGVASLLKWGKSTATDLPHDSQLLRI